MDGDDDQPLIGIGFMPLLDVRLNGFAVVTAKCPKLYQDDLASEVRGE